MNPLKIFDYEPLDRSKLNFVGKILAWFVEYFARILGALYLSIILLAVSVIPFKSASKKFFEILEIVSTMYNTKWGKKDEDAK